VAKDVSTRNPVLPTRGWSVASAGAVTAWVVVATVLQITRQPGIPAVDTIWAEDGQLFLADAVWLGGGSILNPAGGYLHLAPRLLAFVAAALPIQWSALVFALGSALIVSLLSVYVFVASRPALPSVRGRATLAAAMVLLPAAAFESVANAANLQYYFLFAAFWTLVHRPATRGGTVVASFVALVATGSTTLTLVFAPMAVWKAVRRHGLERVVGVAFLVGLSVQALTVFRAVVLDADPTLAQYPVRWSGSDATDLPGLYGLRIGAALLFGDRWVDDVWRGLGWTLAVFGLAAAAILVAAALVRGGSTLPWVLLAGGFSVLTFVLPATLRGTGHLLPTAEYSYAGNRFSLVPMWMLLTAALAVVDRTRHHGPGLVVVLVLAVLTAASYRIPTPRSAGPSWSSELVAAERVCSAGEVDEAVLHIAPAFRVPSAWRVQVPCERLG
jgi:hypothetical protein